MRNTRGKQRQRLPLLHLAQLLLRTDKLTMLNDDIGNIANQGKHKHLVHLHDPDVKKP